MCHDMSLWLDVLTACSELLHETQEQACLYKSNVVMHSATSHCAVEWLHVLTACCALFLKAQQQVHVDTLSAIAAMPGHVAE